MNGFIDYSNSNNGTSSSNNSKNGDYAMYMCGEVPTSYPNGVFVPVENVNKRGMENEEEEQQQQQREQENKEQMTNIHSYTNMYICPAAADAARNSSRELLQALLRRSDSAQIQYTPQDQLFQQLFQQQVQQESIPLAITWHPTNIPPSSFQSLPHKKRTRDAVSFYPPNVNVS
ncbi:uncharacterized protein TM35_000121700, partial [Trypanosoma theileri]